MLPLMTLILEVNRECNTFLVTYSTTNFSPITEVDIAKKLTIMYKANFLNIKSRFIPDIINLKNLKENKVYPIFITAFRLGLG